MPLDHLEEYPDRLVIRDSIKLDSGEPILIGAQCRECSAMFFPYRDFCQECLSALTEQTSLSKTGRLEAYTIIHAGGQTGFTTPYACGFIHLPEDIRLYSLLTEYSTVDDFHVDQQMELVVDRIKTDTHTQKDVYGHKFKPVGE